MRVAVRNGQSADKAIRLFKKKVEKEGILRDAKERRYYEKPSVRKKKKKKRAEKRRRKAQKKEAEK